MRTSIKEVFTVLSDIFGCADWNITSTEDGFKAEASRCMLCAFAKKMNSASPCHIYCLNPMEGMVKGLNPNYSFGWRRPYGMARNVG
ncbi:MAG TPA: hypothetical protein DDW65_24570 [Firmicutes bacterium]|nr:hypothetical protein [Bacillota bacterium]